MGYFTTIYIFLYLLIRACEVSSITTRIDHQPVRNFRRHTGPPPFTDWELGLREAVHQALLREHYTDPTLREQLLQAPLLGRQNNASPFGDIAVLARGQLYITADGFKFVQDSDQEDCDCHNPRCVTSSQCQLWTSLGHHHKLLSLWTVKRIRHRDPHYGHVFEIEYTISPITSVISEELVRRHGYFNYNVPGHIFVVKSDPRLNSAYYLNGNGDKWYKNQQPAEQHRDYKEHGSGHFKPGILIGVSPDGYKHVLHSFPGFYSSYHNDQTTIDPKEYELYKKLIESLAAKTSNVPHRFSVTSEKTTKPGVLTTTFVPVLQTTLVQVLDGQLVPLTESTFQPTTTLVRFPTTSPAQVTKYSEPDQLYHTTTTKVPTLEPPKPITVPMTTTIHYYTPVEDTSKPSTATTPKRVIATTSKIPKKPTTLQEIDNFDIFTTKPVRKTTRKSSTVAQKTTHAVTTEAEQVELFPFNTSTEPMKPVTESSKQTSPDSVSEQLPPPDNGTDTTIAYISSTVTQAPTFKTETVAATTPKKTKIATTTKKLISTFAPSAREEITTVIEKIPYTEQRTTVILPVPSTQEERTTPLGRVTEQPKTTTVIDKIYTLTATPSTIERKTTSIPQTTTFVGVPSIPGTTIFDRGTTQIFTISEETIPSTIANPTTQTTTIYTKPTTLFEYNFDSITRTTTGNSGSTTNTLPSTTNHFPSTETIKYTIPTTTTHYYYTFETDVPKSTVTTESTTLASTTNNKSTYQDEESTISTQGITSRTTKKQKISSTTTSDFLVDSEINTHINAVLDTRKDFNEDDIFGEVPTKATTTLPETTTKRAFQSDLDRALFGGRRSKQIKLSSKITRRPPTANTTKIIYSNFYVPSIQTSLTRNGLIETTTGFEGTTEFRPSTDQSYSTSISFEVNKRKSTKSTNALESTTKASLVRSNRKPKFYKAQLPRNTEVGKITTERSKSQTKKVFDDAAQQLVNHAKTIDYLHKKTSRQPKYRRRSFTTQRSLRRSSVHENNNSKKVDT
ncbi:mucin-3A-like [Zophobas morio]|uniref:mucin-3A-like n=1 Tax=Zophobas morio TaxID=2755281 RepID=UPI0030830D27